MRCLHVLQCRTRLYQSLGSIGRRRDRLAGHTTGAVSTTGSGATFVACGTLVTRASLAALALALTFTLALGGRGVDDV